MRYLFHFLMFLPGYQREMIDVRFFRGYPQVSTKWNLIGAGSKTRERRSFRSQLCVNSPTNWILFDSRELPWVLHGSLAPRLPLSFLGCLSLTSPPSLMISPLADCFVAGFLECFAIEFALPVDSGRSTRRKQSTWSRHDDRTVQLFEELRDDWERNDRESRFLSQRRLNSIWSRLAGNRNVSVGRKGNAPEGTECHPCPILRNENGDRVRPLCCCLQDRMSFSRRVQFDTTIDRKFRGVDRSSWWN
jgi:hypothetical protein